MKKFDYIIVAVFFLMLVTVAGADTAGNSAFDMIQAAVKEDLAKSVSEKAVLEELRIVKGAEYLGAGSADMTIRNLYMDGYSGRNKVVYAVYLRDSQLRTVNVVVEASYDMLADVYVTARPLARGDVISHGDYYAVRQKLSKLPVGAITDKKDIDGKTLKVSLTDGVILRSSNLQAFLSAKRGKKVNLIVEGNTVVISAKGTLRNDAVVGEPANVLCDLTKKEVQGVLVTPTLVKVKI
jgi:flagella basal body P-ring formation protein FlgA